MKTFLQVLMVLLSGQVPVVSQASLGGKIQHILVISVDGMHAEDFANYVEQYPNSNLAHLSKSSLIYSQALTTAPSDSFPGTAAMVTGASPKTTGIYYDVSSDRSLSPPNSNCSKVGTEVAYDESIDINPKTLDGGGGIDPKTLPRDPKNNCSPVYPHQFLRVNTIFEVIRAAGGQTAWCDKHLSYEFLQGPSGQGVDDLYTPEINGNPENVPGGITSSVSATENYDTLKVQAILNEIQGKDHSGQKAASVPAIFGMNFQAVSVAQKLDGYKDADFHPSSGLQGALDFVDQSLGLMIQNLAKLGLQDSTVVIVTAKHGQSPVDVSKRLIISDKKIPDLINESFPSALSASTLDDVGLLWLNSNKSANGVADLLSANAADLGILKVHSGAELAKDFGDPAVDSRAPDLIVEVKPGVIYSTEKATKLAEHGGLSDDDRHVALLLLVPGVAAKVITEMVETKQLAPTILVLLGLDPLALQGVQAEGTRSLPLPLN